MDVSRTPLVSTDPSGKSHKVEFYEATPSSGPSRKSALSSNPQTEKLARSAVSRVGRFLLTKCATKRHPGESGLQDEYFLADDLRRPDDVTRTMLAKFEKQIKVKIGQLNVPLPNKFIFIGYKTHQVSGTDYFLKVKASNSGQYFHVRIYETLQQDLLLQDVVGPKFNADIIEIPN